MNKGLYFIPLLESALDRADRTPALADAFLTIERLGREPGYERGYEQFLAFTAAVAEALAEGASGEAGPGGFHAFQRELDRVLRVLEDGPMPAADGRGHPESIAGLPERIRVAIERAGGRARRFELRLARDGREITAIALVDGKGAAVAGGIVPGPYTLSTETGWVLWECELGAKDLLLDWIRPGQPLELAADTGPERRLPPTRRFSLLGGDVEVLVFAGLDSGRLSVEGHPRKGRENRDPAG